MLLHRKICPLVLILFMTINPVSASTLLVMGDSLSAAYNLRPEKGWVSLLQNHLNKAGQKIDIINASVSGETTQGGLSRFPQLLAAHQPEWVILELGANDALRGYPLDKTQQNLASMIEQAQQINANVLLLGNRIPLNYGKRYTEMFFGLYQNLANDYQLVYMPFMLKDVATNKDLMQADELHPNAAAQPVILENILPYVTSLLSPAN